MLLPLLALATAVQAADLHVEITPPGGEPTALDFPDVRPGALPGFVVAGADGAELIVHVDLSRLDGLGEDPQIRFDVVIQELRADKKGRAWLKVLSSPTIVALVNQPANVTQGAIARALSIDLLYSDSESPAPAVDNPEDPR